MDGSHMRSPYELRQNVVGIGILWKYAYYEQERKQGQTMYVLFQEKVYGFLKKTDIKFTIEVSGHEVWVTAFHLAPEIFHTAPIFFSVPTFPKMTTCPKRFATGFTIKIRKLKLPLLFYWDMAVSNYSRSSTGSSISTT